MNLNDLLRGKSFGPQQVLVLRHRRDVFRKMATLDDRRLDQVMKFLERGAG